MIRALFGGLWLAACGAGNTPVDGEVELARVLRGGSLERVRVVVTPISGPDTAAAVAPLEAYLEEYLGIDVDVDVAKSYDALEHRLAMDADEPRAADVAVISPLAYVSARRRVELVPIAGASSHGSPTYSGYLVVRKKRQELQALGDLKGTRIAWVHELSTSGYLYPRSLIRWRGHDPEVFFDESPGQTGDGAPLPFAGDHISALKAVVNGDVDVAAVSSSYMRPGREFAGLDGSALRVVAKTERIPFDCVVVRPEVPAGTAVALQNALLQLEHHEDVSQQLASRWAFGSFVPFDHDGYERIEAVWDAEQVWGQGMPDG